MRHTLLAAALVCASTLVHAETLDMPAELSAASVLPAKGMSMGEVQRQFGAPKLKHAAAGGGSAQQPPITRWDYDGFSVFFERSTVIDTVRPDAPAPIAHKDELRATP